MTIFSVALYGCKKNTATPSTNQLIIGKWKLISSSTKEYQNNVLINTTEYTANYNFYITFRSNGTCTIESNNPSDPGTEEGTYTISDNIITFRDSNGFEGDPNTIYEISDSQFVWGYNDESGNYRVVSRTIFNKVN